MISDEEFLRIAVYMKQRYGIDLHQKKVIINGRLENRIKAEGFRSFGAFFMVWSGISPAGWKRCW